MAMAISTASMTGAPFAGASLEPHVGYLASTELGGRAPGTPGDFAAREFIANRFACLGLTPGANGEFEQRFTNEAGVRDRQYCCPDSGK